MLFHFAFAYKKNKLLCIGQNNPEKTHPRALMVSNKFKTDIEYPYLHAETDVVSKLWNTHKIDSSIDLVVLRLSKHGKVKISKPCRRCEKVIRAVGFGEVWWSTNTGFASYENRIEIPR